MERAALGTQVRNRIFFKLLAAFALVVLVTAFTLDTSIRRAWEASLRDEIQRHLTQKTLLLAHRVEIDRQHSLQDIIAQEGQAAGARATVIDPTGRVLADSETDPSSMENHTQQKEMKAALAGNVGVDERRSRTIGIPFLLQLPCRAAHSAAYPLSGVEASSSACTAPPRVADRVCHRHGRRGDGRPVHRDVCNAS